MAQDNKEKKNTTRTTRKATKTTKAASTTVEKKSADKAFGVAQKTASNTNLEQVVVNLAGDLLAEQRSRKRWGIFFKLSTLAIVFAILYLAFNVQSGPPGVPFGVGGFVEHIDDGESFTAVVDVKGVIWEGEPAGADEVIENLRMAFEHPGTRGVILDINCPGGSPAQSGQIYDELIRLRELYPDIPVYAVISDLGASGGYYIAAAATEIYADRSSIVGSIGVISSGFGFTELMKKIGVERRVQTAGTNKAFLDPFAEVNEEAKSHWQTLLDSAHKQFIDRVLETRGDKIKNRSEVFSGYVYDGEQALEVGLVDGLGDKRYVAREIIGHEELRPFILIGDDWWLQVLKDISSAMATEFVRAIQFSSVGMH